MRYAPLAALAACALCALCISAARPFERLGPADSAVKQLAALQAAGLLEGLEPSGEDVSRLEAAVLTQRALNGYGERLAAGAAADSALEASLDALSTELAAELAQLGYRSTAPAPASTGELAARLDRLETNLLAQPPVAAGEEGEDEGLESDTYRQQVCPDCGEPEAEAAAAGDAVSVAVYGDIYLQARFRNTEAAPDSTNFSDLDIYWGEMGVKVDNGPWSGQFSLLLNDAANTVDLHEAWGKYQDPENGWFAQAGRMVLPFGNNSYYFPTYPMVNDLGYTRARALATGWDRPDWALRAYLFNPEVEQAGSDNTLSEYSLVWDIARKAPNECEDGYKLVAGYTSYLPQHDLRLAGGGPLSSGIAAYNLFGRYDFCGNTWHMLADFTQALDEYAVTDLDANADGLGDLPSAMNVELVHEPVPDTLWGVNYQLADEMAGYPDTRWGLLYGQRLSAIAKLKLEYSHGKFGAFAQNGETSDDSFVAELNLAF